jgi:hypothetical protein
LAQAHTAFCMPGSFRSRQDFWARACIAGMVLRHLNIISQLEGRLLGAGLIIAGMVLRHLNIIGQLEGRLDRCDWHRDHDRLPPVGRISACAAFFRLGSRILLYALRHPLAVCVSRRRHLSRHWISAGQRSPEPSALYGIWDHNRRLSYIRLPSLARYREKNRANPCRHVENVSAPRRSTGER